jgi:hypothetical protein
MQRSRVLPVHQVFRAEQATCDHRRDHRRSVALSRRVTGCSTGHCGLHDGASVVIRHGESVKRVGHGWATAAEDREGPLRWMGKRCKPVCKPDSVPTRRWGTAIHLGCRLPGTSCGLTRDMGRATLDAEASVPVRPCSGRGLPGRPVTRPPVGSYPTISPLPRPRRPRLCNFCGTLLRVAPTGCYPAPCSVESGLSSGGVPPAAVRPACPASVPRPDGASITAFRAVPSRHRGTPRSTRSTPSPSRVRNKVQNRTSVRLTRSGRSGTMAPLVVKSGEKWCSAP